MQFQSRLLTRSLALCATLAHAGCSSEKAAGPEPEPVVVDSLAPVISHFEGPNGPAPLGGKIEIIFLVRDETGVKQTILSAEGAFQGVDTLDYEDRPPAVQIRYTIPVPDDANVDVPVVFTLVVSDDAGHTKQGQTSVWIADLTEPQARLDLGGLHGDETIRTGETLDVFINAGDNHQLSYIGYEGGGLRDSVPASGTGDSHAFRLTVPQSWLTQRPVLSAWARDGTGRLSGDGGIGSRQIPVYNWTDRPVFIIPVPLESPLDVLWDARRNVVYRLNSSRIDGVSVLSGVPIEPIPLPEGPYKFAFSASGDSLVVTLPYIRSLGIVDLLPSQRQVTTMSLAFDENRGPAVAQASGGRFFVALVGGWNAARLLEVNFGTGTHVIRTDIDGGPDLVTRPNLLRLPDGRLVIGAEEAGYLDTRVIYQPVSDNFMITRRLRAVEPRRFSASPSGRFMMGSTVFGSTLDSIATVSTQDWPEAGGAELSHDGLSVYLPTLYGYQKVRVSDGLMLEQVKLGMTPMYLFASPDGSRLIALGESVVKVVDLR